MKPRSAKVGGQGFATTSDSATIITLSSSAHVGATNALPLNRPSAWVSLIFIAFAVLPEYSPDASHEDEADTTADTAA
jgi:hypothetical protein